MVEHILLAILIQLLVRIISGSWISGTIAACAWFLSREIAQAEYRWIEEFGGGLRANMPWWGRFDPRVWQKADQWLDWVLPTLVTLIIALVAQRREKAATSS
jgi:hypothetical protein